VSKTLIMEVPSAIRSIVLSWNSQMMI